MLYQHLPSATHWTVGNIASTLMVHCWVGMKRESFTGAEAPHCRSSQTRTSTTCFRGLYQTIITTQSVVHTRNRWVTMCGLMHTLAPSTTLTNGIGSTANLQVCYHTHLSIIYCTVMNFDHAMHCMEVSYTLRLLCESVCLSVCLLYPCFVSLLLNISSNFFQ